MRNKLLYLIIIIVIISGVGLKIYDEPVQIPFVPTPESIYNAWIPGWDQTRSFDSLNNANHKLGIVSPMWYILDEKGQLKAIEKIDYDKFKLSSQKANIKILPGISNNFDAKRVSKLINNPDLSKSFSDELITQADINEYQGWDIDFEELDIKDKDTFSGFIENLSQELHKKNLFLSVSVHAQLNGRTSRDAAESQDWSRLSKNADYIRIMAYDFHNKNTSPGPITPLDEYKLVLKKAAKTMPRDKIVIGLPLYGYSWGKDKNISLEYQTARDIAKKLNVNFTRDKGSKELTLKYKENNINREIWIEDSQSVMEKIELARKFGIYQFCFWRLGGEDQNIWSKLK